MGSSALETGGGLSLPVWIAFMEHALKGVPVSQYLPPERVVQVDGEWYFEEFARGAGVTSLGLEDKPGTPVPATDRSLPPADEKRRILDLFRN